MFRKIISLTLLLLLTATCAFPSGARAEGKALRLVTTIFPIYDWAREIVGENENVQLTFLQDSGVDLHSFQPSAADIMKIATCDVMIYVGGESDEWMEDALKEAVNPDMIVLNLVEAMGGDIKMEQIVEGMEHEHHDHDDHDHDDDDHDDDHDHEDEDHDHDDDHDDDHDHEDEDHDHDDDHDHEDKDHDHDHEEEADEHVWLSLRKRAEARPGHLRRAGEGGSRKCRLLSGQRGGICGEAGRAGRGIRAGSRRGEIQNAAVRGPLPLPLPDGRLRAELLRGLLRLLRGNRSELPGHRFPGREGERTGAAGRADHRRGQP